MRCHEIMNPRVERIGMDEPVRAAAVRMRDYDIGFLPVTDSKGLVVGTITDRDITIRAVAEGNLTGRCGDFMTREVISCFANDDVDRAEELMSLYQKSRVVVLDDQGYLAGVISLADIARSRKLRESGDTLKDIKAETHNGS
jgi:CBS domain-containing protein